MRRLRQESGFTLIEVLVAALILGIAVIGISLLFTGGENTSAGTQLQAEAINVADQQIEQIRAQVAASGFNALALSSAPVPDTTAPTSIASTIPSDPNSYVVTGATGCGGNNTGFAIAANYDNTAAAALTTVDQWSGCGTSGGNSVEPLVILSGGLVKAQQTSVPVGSDTATIDTYVTDTYVGCLSSGSTVACPTVSTTAPATISGCTWAAVTLTTSTPCADVRRVTVAVVLNSHGSNLGGASSPMYVSTIFTNPNPSTTAEGQIGLSLGVSL